MTVFPTTLEVRIEPAVDLQVLQVLVAAPGWEDDEAQMTVGECVLGGD